MKIHPYTITLDKNEREELLSILSTSGIDPSLHARATILKLLDEGLSAPEIAREASVARTTVYSISNRYRQTDLKSTLFDGRKAGMPRRIPLEAFDWVRKTAETAPLRCGVEAERWTISSLQEYVRKNGPLHGFPELSKLSRSYLWRICNNKLSMESEEHAAKRLATDDSSTRMIMIRHFTVETEMSNGLWKVVSTDDAATPGPCVRDTVHLIVGFDSGSDALHVRQCTGSLDRDMIEFLTEIDRSTPLGVIIELLETSGSPELTPGAYRFLFARTGRFSLVRNRNADKVIRKKIITDAILDNNQPFINMQAPTQSELVKMIVGESTSYRIPD